MEKPTFHPRWIRELFFWVGIIATIAYRIIIIVDKFNPNISRLMWYIGTVGFIIYFYHRYQISEKRTRLIKQHNLDIKVENGEPFTDEDKKVMDYIFTTLKSTKEKWNYIFIFVVSALALILTPIF